MTILIIEQRNIVSRYISNLLTQLNYDNLVVNTKMLYIEHVLQTKSINIILLPIDTDIELIWQIYLTYKIPLVFYTQVFHFSTFHQLATLPKPIYLIRSYNVEDFYVNIELCLHAHSEVVKK